MMVPLCADAADAVVLRVAVLLHGLTSCAGPPQPGDIVEVGIQVVGEMVVREKVMM